MFVVLALTSLLFDKFVVDDKTGKDAIPQAESSITSSTSPNPEQQNADPAASDTLEACLSDIRTLLPALAEDDCQLIRNSITFNQQDDAEMMLTRASAEIYCTYAEELFEQGRSKAAFKIMTKVRLSASLWLAHLSRHGVTSNILNSELRARGA